MLTYESLRKFLEEEKSQNKLVSLPEDFFSQARMYLEKKAKLKEGTEDVWEADASRRALTDLLELREHKLVNLALFHVRSGVLPGSLTVTEQVFFDQLVSELKAFRTRRRDEMEGPSEPMALVAFELAVPQFIGLDLKSYGPYQPGEVGTVPNPQAELLVKQGLARRLEAFK